jgi:ComF family protein
VIDGARAPYRFELLLREAIHQFKYQNLRSLAPILAGFLASYLTHNALPTDILVPVPIHPQRLKERGYNQSLLLALELGRLTNLQVVENVLIRNMNTPPQAKTANLAARRQHMTTAFFSRGDKLRGKRILLVDDVATSGATLNGCAIALKNAGVNSVWGLTLAREVRVYSGRTS